MDDAFFVAGGERVGDLDADVEDLLEVHGLTEQPVLQAEALQLLHDDEGLPVRVVFDVVNGADAGMIELRSGARLAYEALQRFGIASGIGGNEFQRDMPAQTHVFGVIDQPHPTTTEFPHDVIVGNGLADNHPPNLVAFNPDKSKSGLVAGPCRWR